MAHTRDLLVMTLVPGLLWVGVATAAEEPAGPTVVVEAAEQPTVRAAISFPQGWRLEATTDDDARRYVNALAIDERCEIGTRRSEFPDLRTDVDDFEVTLAPGSGYIFLQRQSVELPTGPAERVDLAANDEGGRWSVYAIWDEGFVHELWCRGDELPDDRWLPIAETLDVDPDPALTSSEFDPIVARPDAGMAMAFPEGWQVRGSSTNQGLLYATSEHAVCAVSDYSALAGKNGWTSLEDMHDEYVGIADERDNLTLNESAYLELPGGRTGFADIGFDDGTQALRYSFSDGETYLALFCVADPVPDDRYRPLAESLTWRAGPAADEQP
jgi:hypothetical protein